MTERDAVAPWSVELEAPDLPEALAAHLVDLFRAFCARRQLALAVAVVDRGGNPVATSRRDGSQLGAYSLALDKAYTAVAFGASTSRWSTSSAPGGSDWGLAGSLGGRAAVIAGGVALFRDGRLLGGLGVSGTASAVDEECALAVAHDAGLETR